jgi:hypothetical protein
LFCSVEVMTMSFPPGPASKKRGFAYVGPSTVARNFASMWSLAALALVNAAST